MSLIDYQIDGDIAVATLRNPPVNALGGALRVELIKALQAAENDTNVGIIILRGNGGVFSAGADIREMGTATARLEPSVRGLHDYIERMKTFTVAAVSGNALGGGFELALACDARIADKTARFGLPEVKLGLLPGAGGTQRLPQLVGSDIALDLLTSGRSLSTDEALGLGIIDAVVQSLDEEQLHQARAARDKRRTPALPKQSTQVSFDIYRSRLAASAPGFVAPLAIVDCVEAAATGDRDAGFATESRKLAELRKNPQHEALRYLFLAERSARKVEAIVPTTFEPRTITAERSTRDLLRPLLGAEGSDWTDRDADLQIVDEFPKTPGARDVLVSLVTPATSASLVQVVCGVGAPARKLGAAAWLARQLSLPIVFTQGADPLRAMWDLYAEHAAKLEANGVSRAKIIAAVRAFGMSASPLPEREGADTADGAPNISDETILHQLLFPVALEGMRAVRRGIVARASDIDVAWVHGYGFPAYRGGPLYWAEHEAELNARAVGTSD